MYKEEKHTEWRVLIYRPTGRMTHHNPRRRIMRQAETLRVIPRGAEDLEEYGVGVQEYTEIRKW